MLLLISVMMLLGVLSGLRYNVFIMAPVTAMACLFIAVASNAFVPPDVSKMVIIIATATSLQFGYLCGLFLRRDVTAVAQLQLPFTRREPRRTKTAA